MGCGSVVKDDVFSILFQQLYLGLSEILRRGSNYTLRMSFKTALKEGLDGFYLSSYVTADGERRYATVCFLSLQTCALDIFFRFTSSLSFPSNSMCVSSFVYLFFSYLNKWKYNSFIADGYDSLFWDLLCCNNSHATNDFQIRNESWFP